MRMRALVLATLLGAAAVWLGGSELAWPARLVTVLLLVVLPVLLLGQANVPEEDVEALPVIPIYVSSMVSIALLAGVSAWAAGASGFTREELGFAGVSVPAALAWIGTITLAALALMALGRWFGRRETPLLEKLIPRTGSQRSIFVLLSITAGIGEEIAFRGFLHAALLRATGSLTLAVALGSFAFGMLHSYQHSAGVLRAATLGALLAVPVIVTGSILPSMIAHALIDLIAGLLLADWLLGASSSDAVTPED